MIELLIMLSFAWTAFVVYCNRISKEEYVFIPIWPGTAIHLKLTKGLVEVIIETKAE